ncbi:hypothetical protein ACFVIM_24960, partial [Streptomyces sp. NPDC057638]
MLHPRPVIRPALCTAVVLTLAVLASMLLPRPDPATASPGVPEPGTKMPTEAKVAAEAEATPRPRSRARTVSPAALPPPPPPVSGTPDDA